MNRNKLIRNKILKKEEKNGRHTFVAFLVWNLDGKSISHHDLISLAFWHFFKKENKENNKTLKERRLSKSNKTNWSQNQPKLELTKAQAKNIKYFIINKNLFCFFFVWKENVTRSDSARIYTYTSIKWIYIDITYVSFFCNKVIFIFLWNKMWKIEEKTIFSFPTFLFMSFYCFFQFLLKFYMKLNQTNNEGNSGKRKRKQKWFL